MGRNASNAAERSGTYPKCRENRGPANCTYAISPGGQAFTASGGSGTVSITAAAFVREEFLEIAGTKLDCYVVTTLIAVPKEGTTVHTLWIEKKSNRILRDDHANSSVVFTTIRINEPLPDDLFKFVPPPGARKIVEK
jgi:outer membrane lipoprotein-sorting protein